MMRTFWKGWVTSLVTWVTNVFSFITTTATLPNAVLTHLGGVGGVEVVQHLRFGSRSEFTHCSLSPSSPDYWSMALQAVCSVVMSSGDEGVDGWRVSSPVEAADARGPA